MTAIHPGQDDSDNSVQEKREQHDQGPALVEIIGDSDALAEQTEQPHVPDGGFIAWLQVAGSWLLFFNSWSVFEQYQLTTRLTDYHSSQGHHQYIRGLPDILRNHRLH
jgi:hypothetical protein